ncbi:MAG: tetratricopeptide repeat protein [Candidatus Rokubacteria bacterium]|nr:tetratricopeptide repeat protein [Candidatus Rokubacteria bacterium]
MRSATSGCWAGAGALVALLVSACATASVPPAPAVLDLEAQERALRARVGAHGDAPVAELVARVTATLLTDAERAARTPDVVVLRDPTIAAFVVPSGRIYLHTGLLARLGNEAQLAVVLGRALTQAARRADVARGSAIDDALLAMREAVGASLATPDAAVAVVSPAGEAILGRRLDVIYMAAVIGDGRDLESDADAGALGRLVRAGYDPKEAPRAFERLRREAKAGGQIERFFLGRDAVLAERIETLTRLVARDHALAAAAPGTSVNTREFDEAIVVVARDNARLELQAGRFRAAEDQLDRALSLSPGDARAHLVLGELHRLRAQRARGAADRDDLARRALAAYERAEQLDPTLSEVARQTGLLYYQQGQRARAREAFARYLASQPDAPDAARVREYLAALSP